MNVNLNVSIFLDLKNAFDMVSHDILLSKLSARGICGKTHCLFKTFLENRKQICYVKGQKSLANRTDCGIPQGLCLGSLLFIRYINDFEHYLQGATPNLYADDTSIACLSSDSASLQGNIDIEMANVVEWMKQDRLSLNTNKSQFMVIKLFKTPQQPE